MLLVGGVLLEFLVVDDALLKYLVVGGVLLEYLVVSGVLWSTWLLVGFFGRHPSAHIVPIIIIEPDTWSWEGLCCWRQWYSILEHFDCTQ